MRILAIDPGSKRIGVAISDPTASLARPLCIIDHRSRLEDAKVVLSLVETNQAELVIVGQSVDERGSPTFEGRRSARFADMLKARTDIPVILWDETFTTQDARATRLAAGASRRKRSGHLDDVAAAILLQSYLDAHPASTCAT